tara:strand:+ start:599 stop:910 length:312 start_codon:yes stop_codon:yes gene_type:complete
MLNPWSLVSPTTRLVEALMAGCCIGPLSALWIQMQRDSSDEDGMDVVDQVTIKNRRRENRPTVITSGTGLFRSTASRQLWFRPRTMAQGIFAFHASTDPWPEG